MLERCKLTLRCTVIAAIDAGAPSSDRADIYHSPPSLLLHVRHGQLGDDERTPQVHVDRVIPFLDVKLENIADPLPVPSVGHDYVGMFAMGFFDLVK